MPRAPKPLKLAVEFDCNMKKLICLSAVFIFASCGISDDCIKSSGDAQIREVPAEAFDKLFVYPGIAVEITQGDSYSVAILAGSNFIDQVEAKFENNTLVLRENTNCNWVRDFGITKVMITAPNITEIYSNTDRDIRSNGVLTYPIIRLFAMDIFDGVGTGNFYLQVNNSQVVVESNNIAAFFIEGSTGELLLNFYDEMSRFEGENLTAGTVKIFQRSSNDMIVRPVNSLTGNIYSTGNVISKSQPSEVNVFEHYTGRLIFD